MSIFVNKNIVVTEAVVAGLKYIIEILKETPTRKKLTEKFGNVWNTKELNQDFDIIKFSDPFVVYVKRKSDNQTGIMFYNLWPRYYFNFRKL